MLELEALRTSENGSGYCYGAAASVNGYVRGRARKPGWASMGKASIPELAHEVGHNVSLRSDWEDGLPEALPRDSNLGIVTTSGLRDAVRLRR